jgi:hypothetical protein
MATAAEIPQSTEKAPQAPSTRWLRSHQEFFLMRRATATPAAMRRRPAIMNPAWR